ncbi:MAG: hypothetical protein WAW91_02250 [Candidatus Nanoperiomorbaceae bacterium]
MVRTQRFDQHSRHDGNGGYTMIEMSLAMTVLAFIMIFIVTIIMTMVNIYNKSIALSQMGNAGQQIMTDMNSARFSGGSAATVSYSNGGRICANGVSYLWNQSTDHQTFASAPQNVMPDNSSQSLIRVLDPQAELCKNQNETLTSLPSSSSINLNNVSIIIGSTVIIQSMTASVQATNSSLLQISVVISTAGGNAPAYWNGNQWTGNLSNNSVHQNDSGPSAGIPLRCGTNQFCGFATYNFVIYQRSSHS